MHQFFTGNPPVRLEHEGVAVYVWPDKPDWCVPNEQGDFILQNALATDERAAAERYAGRFGVSAESAGRHVRRFLNRLSDGAARPYKGRGEYLELERLGECWLHVTNRCNARCTHCMFACSPDKGEQMDEGLAASVVEEALDLGCRLFYFTGGEPTIYGAFPDLCRRILEEDDTHVVVLTNARTARTLIPEMQDHPHGRVHFQVSVEGCESTHDAVRGDGAYVRTVRNVERLRDAGFPVTLAMTVHRENVDEMSAAVDLAGELGLGNVHYLWLFRRGNAGESLFVTPNRIWPRLREAAELAEARDVLIDNVEIVRSQVFSIPGTRFDLSNAGWESVAVDPAGEVYPSPALIMDERAICGSVRDGLEAVWRDSAPLGELRRSSLMDAPAYRANPLRFLVGGGDVDHSLTSGGKPVGHDPYVELYNRVALWLIAREASEFSNGEAPALRLRMGEYLHECGEGGDGVMFTHSNCVLSLPGKDGHSLVREFYGAAAAEAKEDILNPVQYAEDDISFIPEEARVRSYGCGSPVADADLEPGETVVDLGCGAGMECYLAARQVGADGRVIGVDMLPQMLERAEGAADGVAERLGYANVEFHRGLLEDLPLPDESADVVISNCVINLSPHKRRAFSEIYRILKPGGRLVISDVASQEDVPIEIQYNEKLRGECLGGAFRVDRLFGLLGDVGYRQTTVLKRFPYRKVRGHQFYSITYSAVKPGSATRRLVYRGPFAAVVTEDGRVIERGQVAELPWRDGMPLEEEVFLLDERDNVANIGEEMSCACCTAPEVDDAAHAVASTRHSTDCMVCGAPIEYLERERPQACHYCGERKAANAVCAEGHFVCDACHSEDALKVIRRLLLGSKERDMVALLKRVRRHVAVPIHGPEHHSLVPAIIVTASRNSGGPGDEGKLDSALQRGSTIAGGACAFMGVCGAAAGVGTGFSVLLGATPYKGRERQVLQRAAAEVLAKIAAFEAPRCCQRDCWVALRKAAELSEDVLGIALSADEPLVCGQFRNNEECIGSECPLWPDSGGRDL
mgnify:CR=1 FL=1